VSKLKTTNKNKIKTSQTNIKIDKELLEKILSKKEDDEKLIENVEDNQNGANEIVKMSVKLNENLSKDNIELENLLYNN
jgi:hypothetical protein